MLVCKKIYTKKKRKRFSFIHNCENIFAMNMRVKGKMNTYIKALFDFNLNKTLY